MAQVLKDEIKADILQAALQEFYLHGYHAATMRAIAEQAKIPAGLIYSYYKNKEALFDAVLFPVLYDWEQVLSMPDDNHYDKIVGLSKAELECILHLFDHRQEFIILMEKSTGTKYEQQKEQLIAVIEAHLAIHQKEGTDMVFLHIIASTFVDGLLQIMHHYKGREWAMMLLHKLSAMYLWGIG